MSPFFQTVFNALMGINEDKIREVFFDERDFFELERMLAEKSITLTQLGNFMNFYPGTKGAMCHKYAFFASLNDQPRSSRIKVKEYIKFDELLKQVVMHSQGTCAHNTRHIAILSDNFDNSALEFWRSNLKEIQRNGVEIEFYIFVAGKPVEVQL